VLEGLPAIKVVGKLQAYSGGYSHSTEMSLVSFLNSGSPVTTAALWIKAVAAAKQSA